MFTGLKLLWCARKDVGAGMKKTWRKSVEVMSDEDGQGMTEYVIIVALIALAAIVAVGVFGKQIQEAFRTLTAKLAGDEDKQQEDFSGENVPERKKMSDF